MLTLWCAGITRFTLIDGSTNPSVVHAAALREIARVAPAARLTWISPDDPDPNALTGVRVLAVPTSGIFHIGLVTRLIASPATENQFVAFPGIQDAGLWVLSADAYGVHARGNQVAATHGVLIEGEYFPAGTDAEIDVAERALFRWCTKETDGVVSRNLNRPISNWVSRRLSHGTVRPAQLTAMTGLSALAMFTALIGGTEQYVAIGCVLYHVTSVVDGLDGEIARAKYMSTPRGATLDTAVDMATNLLFMLGISIGSHQVYDPIYGWVGGYVAFTASIAMMVMALTLHFGPGGGSFDVLELTIRRRLRGSPRLSRIFGFINAFFKRDLFAFVFAIMGATGFAESIPWLLAFGATAWLIAILANVPTLLNSRREEVLPPHLLGTDGSGTADYAGS
ncbi:MAG: hypothetical protein EPO08_00860 [Rhodospirillaceae bacterium]|nr:MAG: hypothetical protein EPO08_00860 [Rhodospirillaceae bacterium]